MTRANERATAPPSRAFAALSQTSEQILELIATNYTKYDQERAYTWNFQLCDAAGFTQRYSRNSGYSMGAPLEYWGRVVGNQTAPTPPYEQVQKCLTASSEPNRPGTFHLLDCDEVRVPPVVPSAAELRDELHRLLPVREHHGLR